MILASHTFLEDLAMVLCVAAVTTVVFQKIRQPVVVGYLIAGMIVGPNVPIPLLADSARIHTISELGVILLMFALGLEFSLGKLVKMGPTSGFITMVQVGLMVWLGYMCGKALGWTDLESIFTGAILSISSTTIVAKAYQETPVPERLRNLVFGVLLTEDLTAVVELAVLTTLASGAAVSATLMTVTVGRLVLFLVAMVGGGMLLVPPAIRMVVRLGRAETTLVASIGICFAFAILAEVAGYSVALGAFLAGSMVAESGEVEQIEHLVAPVRDMFGAVFFVSVGMMIDPGLIAEHWVALVVLTLAVILGKTIGVSLASVLTGTGITTSIEAGMSLAQIGEFSFIIAGVGLQMHATRDFLYTLAVAVSALTTFLTPYMIRVSAPVAESISSWLPQRIKLLEALYSSWIEHMRMPHAPDAEQQSIFWPTAASLAAAGLIAVILIVNELDPADITSVVAQLESVTYFQAGVLVDAFALLLCLVPGAGLYSATRRLATALAHRAFTGAPASEETAAPALVELLQAAILVLIVMPLLAIVQPFMEPFEGIAIVVITVVLMTFVIARSARRMQGHLGAIARLIAVSLSGTAAEPGHAGEPAHQGNIMQVPGLGTLTSVRMRPDSAGIGRTLADIDLHTNTGAAVVAIGRGDDGVIVPKGDEVLREGDVIELAGSSVAVQLAMRLLNAPKSGHEAVAV